MPARQTTGLGLMPPLPLPNCTVAGGSNDGHREKRPGRGKPHTEPFRGQRDLSDTAHHSMLPKRCKRKYAAELASLASRHGSGKWQDSHRWIAAATGGWPKHLTRVGDRASEPSLSRSVPSRPACASTLLSYEAYKSRPDQERHNNADHDPDRTVADPG